LVDGNTKLFSKNLTYAMVCNTWWGGTWTRFGDSSVVHINVPNYSISGVCYTTTSGIEAFNHAIGGIVQLIKHCRSNISNFKDTLQWFTDFTLDSWNGICTKTTQKFNTAKYFKTSKGVQSKAMYFLLIRGT
jgi:hypothetical protein